MAEPAATAAIPPGASSGVWPEVWTSIELHKLAEQLAGLNNLAGTFRMQRDAGAIMDLIVRAARVIVPFDELLLAEAVDEVGDFFRICMSSRRSFYAPPQSQDRAALKIYRGGFVAQSLRAMTPTLFRELYLNPSSDAAAAEFLAGMRSALLVPLHRAADSGPEMMLMLSQTPGKFTEDDLRESVVLANLAAAVVSNLWLGEQLRTTFRRLDEELKAVAEIQMSLLPGKPADLPGWSQAVHYATSTAAGGDYYDFFPLARGRTGIVIADASGHGAPAAVVMAVTRAILHGCHGPEMPPVELLTHVNKRLIHNIVGGHFVTAWFGVLDPATGDLEYAGAGHNPPFVHRRSTRTVEELTNPAGLPLGLFPEAKFARLDCRLEPGDTLLLYTDGLIEAMNRKREQFSPERVKELLSAHAAEGPAALRDRIVAAVKDHVGDAPASDDLTLVALRRAPE
jgi:sigma-B regulation protein RsbU (phosphoserine phosphatase)